MGIQKRARGTILLATMFIILVLFLLVTVQVQRARNDLRWTSLDTERTRKLFMAKGAVNAMLAQIRANPLNTRYLESEESGYTVKAQMYAEPEIPDVFQIIGTAYPVGQPSGAIRTLRVVKKDSHEAARRFLMAPPDQIKGPSLPTFFAYEGEGEPWKLLPPVCIDDQYPDKFSAYLSDPGGAFYVVHDPTPNDENPGTVARINPEDGSWSVFSRMPEIPEPGPLATDGSGMFIAHGLSKTDVSYLADDSGGWASLPSPGREVKRLLTTSEVGPSSSSTLVAVVPPAPMQSNVIYYDKVEQTWESLPSSAPQEYYDSDGNLQQGGSASVALDQVEASEYGLYGVWKREGKPLDTLFVLRDGKWKSLPPIPNWKLVNGELVQDEGYVTEIKDLITDPFTGVVSVKIESSDGKDVVVPIAGSDPLPPLQREYHVSPEQTRRDSGGWFRNPPVVAGGGPGDMTYSVFQELGRW